MKKKLPDLASEKALWKKGFSCVAGVDEVGRGAWAGPVVAAAVAFSDADVRGPAPGFPPRKPTKGDPFLEALLPGSPARLK